VDLAHLFHLTDLLDHEFQALSGFINLLQIAHKVKPEDRFIEACVSERTYYRSVQIHYFEDESTTDRFNPTISRDELTNRSVQSHELEDNLSTD
jgi:uncharacterized protein YqkB